MPEDPAARSELHRRVYNEHAQAFDAQRGKTLFERVWLDRFLSSLPKEAEILDMGCGSAEPIAAYLIERGHRVTGVDFAPAMLDLARNRFPDHAWIEADMTALCLEQNFDGIIAWNSFFHLTMAQQSAMFPIFAHHLKPGGALMFTSGPSAGESVPGTVNGQTVLHSSHSPAGYTELMESNGLELRQFKAEDNKCRGHTVWIARKTTQA